ncbi:TRAP transporter small permease [Gimibacter soli]|uniref:TRAP transporter small permease protein n=1 Tax=Gimibacter soli TaxID=3024400 RepID=A0AAF0BIM1_9PROT|nr:TRAP transporter small permease [Gimibacter soli]WCL55573.1 TRAP transporter small permease [Gimibacter soli]
MTLISLLRAIMRSIDRLCLGLGLAAMLLMLVCVCLQIVARYVLNSPPAWTEELARYAMVWGAMLGATCAYYRRLDPTLSVLRPDLTRRQALLRQIVETAAIALFIGPVLWFAPATVERLLDRPTETLGFSTGVIVAIIPVTMAIILLYAFVRIVLVLADQDDFSKETGS